jgi:hypothetical protein
MKITEQDMNVLDAKAAFMNLAVELIEGGSDPLSVATAMTQIGFGVYKTVLPADDYTKMVNFISESRDRIQAFEV